MNTSNKNLGLCLAPRSLTFGLALGLAVGLATKNLAVGIAIALLFSGIFGAFRCGKK